MKQFVLLVIFSLLFFTAQSQLTKGIWLVGGSGSFYSYNEDYQAPSVDVTAKYTTIDVSASIGYFFMDKLSGGLRPYFSSFKGESSGGGASNDLKFAIGPFARYYFLKEGNQYNLLADVSYQAGINKSFGGIKPKGKYNTFSVMTGAELFFNTAIGLEILVGYKSQIATFENSPSAYESNRKGFHASIGFTLHLVKE